MTIIAGLIDKGRVWMGCDSLSTSGFDACVLHEPKIFRSGSFMVGLTGYARVGQLIRYKLTVKEDDRKSAHETICVDFVDKLRQILGDNGAKAQEDSVDGVMGRSSMLVGYRGELFEIESNFQVVQRAGSFNAIGCGVSFALASLHETASLGLQPKDRLMRALKCAEHFSIGCRRPFRIFSDVEKRKGQA